MRQNLRESACVYLLKFGEMFLRHWLYSFSNLMGTRSGRMDFPFQLRDMRPLSSVWKLNC
jgi:hypothetical protein